MAEKKKRPILRKIALAIVAIVVLILAVPAYFYVRFTVFADRYDVVSIREDPQYQERALLDRAWALPVASTYRRPLIWQTNGSVCGPSSVVNVLRSRGRRETEDSVLEGSGLCWTGFCLGGLTIEELAGLARTELPDRRIEILRDLSVDELREEMRRSNDRSVRYIANFSPIGGYLADFDLVFVLDVNAEYGPWLVSTERLHDAIDTIDSSTGEKRGLLRIE
jgi:hypothetical protein